MQWLCAGYLAKHALLLKLYFLIDLLAKSLVQCKAASAAGPSNVAVEVHSSPEAIQTMLHITYVEHLQKNILGSFY